MKQKPSLKMEVIPVIGPRFLQDSKITAIPPRMNLALIRKALNHLMNMCSSLILFQKCRNVYQNLRVKIR